MYPIRMAMIKVFQETRSLRAAQYLLLMTKDRFEQEVFDVGETTEDGDTWNMAAYFRDVQNLCSSIAHGDEDSIAKVPTRTKRGNRPSSLAARSFHQVHDASRRPFTPAPRARKTRRSRAPRSHRLLRVECRTLVDTHSAQLLLCKT